MGLLGPGRGHGACSCPLWVVAWGSTPRTGHSPSCLMPSLSSMSSWTLGMSMWSRGPWGGPFTGVSKLRLFLLWKKERTLGSSGTKESWGRGLCRSLLDGFSTGEQGEGNERVGRERGAKGKQVSGPYLISISAKLLASAKQ